MQNTGAAGVVYKSLVEPMMNFSVGNNGDFTPDATNLIEISEDSSNVTCPVRRGSELLGVMWLNFDANYQLDTAARDLLAALTDGLVIVMMKARAQAESQQERRLALSVLHSITDPLLVFDEKWSLLLTNPAAETVFGAQAVAGTSLRDVVQSDELVAFVEGGQPLNEWTSGEKTFVPRVQLVRDANDQPDGWILALRDITQFKKLNRNQNEFVRIVSHDLRSPLTSMQGFTSMLGMVGELNERQSQFIEKILSGIAQIAALVENIQDAGRFDIETGFYEMIRAQCDLSEMVNRIVDNHLVPAEKQELSVTVSVADDVPILNADANMLERALTNLVDNAIKYTPNGGKIDVKAYCKDNSVIISVRDSGLGISPDQQKQLFQRHVRLARQENKKIKGSGLGLFIVKSVAQRHGGDAWVESAENAGSTFFLSIPLSGANLVIPSES
jgi:signal transduction histidine kinase